MIQSKKINIITAIAVILAFSVSVAFVLISNMQLANTSIKTQAEYSSKLFGTDIISLEILADEKDWNEMLENAMSEQYIMADVIVNGNKFTNVGIRPKGNSSLTQVANSNSNRYSFRLQFNEYIKEQTCFGLESFVVNNMLGDNTYMKEYVSYELMQEIGVDSPYFGYADIKVNGEDWGLYLAVELYNDSFEQRVFGNTAGMLYNVKSMDMGGNKGAMPWQQGGNFPPMPNWNGEDNRPQMPNGEDNGNRPQMPNWEGEGDRPQMPNWNGEDNRPQMPNGEGNGNRPQMPNWEGEGDRPQMPNWNGEDNRPQMPNGEGNGNRPQMPNWEGEGDRPQMPNWEGEGDRPQMSNEEDKGDRPRMPNGESDNLQTPNVENKNNRPQMSQRFKRPNDASDDGISQQQNANPNMQNNMEQQIVPPSNSQSNMERQPIFSINSIDNREQQTVQQKESNSNSDNNSSNNTDRPVFPNQMDGGMGDRNKAFGGKGGRGSSGGSLEYIDDNTESYGAIFNNVVGKGTKNDFQRVITALKALSEGKDLEEYFDVDQILRYLAAHTIVVNLDSYSSTMAQNYYLYESEGKLTILPWDYNLAWGGFQSGNASSVINFPIDTPVKDVEMSSRPLIKKLFENSEYLERYHEYLQQLIDEYFANGKFESKLNSLDSLISDYVKNDSTAFCTFDEYKKAVSAFITLGNLRAQSVQGQLDGTIPSTTAEQSANADKLISSGDLKLSDLGSMMGGKGFGDFPNRMGEQNQNAPFGGPEGMINGLDNELFVEAMGIIMQANGKVTDEVKENLLSIGLTLEQVEQLSTMSANPFGGMERGRQPRNDMNVFGAGAPVGQRTSANNIILIGALSIILIAAIIFAAKMKRNY
ncbi:CotH kinase family protein [Ruminiclostridium herbifermentans]|uniref:CotH kinase family protein n=1 Tax=Ruminiclostridium herbifermentans TaxID=2488810 RepID=A0A7H1VL43_9FIRM|nr:CotH kinase family protein [Ruminiclostridium herbifermentans]QNU66105.1 CotH kinase family protein [Ruminiclostridium herbifermentans]